MEVEIHSSFFHYLQKGGRAAAPLLHHRRATTQRDYTRVETRGRIPERTAPAGSRNSISDDDTNLTVKRKLFKWANFPYELSM